MHRRKLFHDFRRTAVRDMLRGGTNPDVIPSITGHETRSIMSGYNVTDDRDQREALRAVQSYRERQAVAQREKIGSPARAIEGGQLGAVTHMTEFCRVCKVRDAGARAS